MQSDVDGLWSMVVVMESGTGNGERRPSGACTVSGRSWQAGDYIMWRLGAGLADKALSYRLLSLTWGTRREKATLDHTFLILADPT